MVRRLSVTAVSSLIALTALAVMPVLLPGCAPAPRGQFQPVAAAKNITGGRTPEGKVITGAGNDQRLATLRLENPIEKMTPADLELAKQIINAKVEFGGKLRAHVVLREGSIAFDFTGQQGTVVDNIGQNEIHFLAVVGKTTAGVKSNYELAMKCVPQDRKPPQQAGCAVATMYMRNTVGVGSQASLIVRNQTSIVTVRTTKKEYKNPIFKTLAEKFPKPETRVLQSFEVNGGDAGFALSLSEAGVCPAGRLVDTSETADEAIKVACPGQDDLRDVEGHLMGNSNRGELFLELQGIGRGVLGDHQETIYILVRRERTAKIPTVTPGTPPKPGGAKPPATDPLDEDDEDDVVPPPPTGTEKTPTSTTQPPKPPVTPVQRKGGWVLPLDFNHPITKTWAKDRNRTFLYYDKNKTVLTSMDQKVKELVASAKLKNFATNFTPNRDLVISKLAQSNVPPEFVMITSFESAFFILPGYPIQAGRDDDVGPWQFTPGTAKSPSIGPLAIKPVIYLPAKTDLHRSGKKGDLCDERADLGKSTAAAGRYFRLLLNMFPHDPRLAVMAYNRGEGGTEKTIKCLQSTACLTSNYKDGLARLNAVKELGYGFWTVHKFRMAPDVSLNYVPHFIAAVLAISELEPFAVPQVPPWKSQCK